ncbi:MAG: gamma-glutamyl-gamma-aminobutyrate hydrolase family protein [Hydrogenothermaceae bacterium]|nr:gamma-glutamyl-gamma-aminobutyrate hydrolase family protein [Hydrogenothermaceae bacterium]
MSRKVLAIRHVKIEHAGMIEEILHQRGYIIEYIDTANGDVVKNPLDEYSLILVLGGYMGAYEESIYPFLSYEFKIMEKALELDIPLLGICLGSQMLAKVLGSKVYKGEKGKEIGFFDVYKVSDHPYFYEFPKTLKVFQWHGDTFDLPVGAERVFTSDKYENQGFVYKRTVGLQFHIEVNQEMIQEWLEEYKDEILQENLNPEKIKEDAMKYIPTLKNYLKALFT